MTGFPDMKYYFWILGCAMNYSDAERIASVLDSLGYERTEDEDEANLFVVISCSVRQSAINRIYGKVKDLKERKAHGQKLTTILSGCVLSNDKKKLSKVFDIMFDIKDLQSLPLLLKGHSEFTSESPEILKQVQDDKGSYFTITPHYESTFRAYVPISTGCDNFCSYCAVPYTKGREKSRPLGEIVSEVKNLIGKGYKEITLLGQNVNSYGHDLPTNASLRGTKQSHPGIDEVDCRVVPPRNDEKGFVNLLKELDAIPGEHRLYFYSNHPKDMTDELIQTLAHLEHFPHYLHLPLQSGNNEILEKMNRHSTREQYLELVKKIRSAMPDITLTTDIIVGYPGETDEQLEDTADIMRQVEYDMAFIAQYSPRSGTVSAKQPDDVTKDEKIEREKKLQAIVRETVLTHNQKLVGTTQRILIDEKKGDKYFGRTLGYKVVEIKTDLPRSKAGQPLEVGQFIDVVIESATSWKLSGRFLVL